MYHPTEMANAITPTSWFSSLYTHASPNQNQRGYPSRLEISSLLDRGASISVLNHPTYNKIENFLELNKITHLSRQKHSLSEIKQKFLLYTTSPLP